MSPTKQTHDTATTHVCDLRTVDVLDGTITRCGCGRAWRYDAGWHRIGWWHLRLMRSLYPKGWRRSRSAE